MSGWFFSQLCGVFSWLSLFQADQSWVPVVQTVPSRQMCWQHFGFVTRVHSSDTSVLCAAVLMWDAYLPFKSATCGSPRQILLPQHPYNSKQPQAARQFGPHFRLWIHILSFALHIWTQSGLVDRCGVVPAPKRAEVLMPQMLHTVEKSWDKG